MQRFRSVPILPTAVAALALIGGSGGFASAQTPAPAPLAASVPTYASPSGDEQIRGTISAVTGKYAIQVRDDRGFLDNVALHQGTIINPTGLTLAQGMHVNILGSNAGSTFNANEIDAPYAVAEAPYYPGNYGYGFASPWAFGPGFGWGPRFRAGFWF